MKNLLTATLPALALLALGGCASTGALTASTETDGVYYSSKDHTTAVGSPAGVYSGNGTYGANSGTIPAKALDDTTPAPVATTEDANPDYQGGTTTSAATGSDYYNNSYSSYNTSGFGQPYTGPGVSSFNYTPSATYAVSPSYYGSPYGYASAFGYGYSPFSYGYGLGGFGYPYGGYGGFYDPSYSPWGFGSGLSIGFGYGFGYPYGGFGSPYGFGGYGYGYSPFYGYGYGGGYGRGYYDAGYARPVIYTRGAGVSSPGAGAVLYGSRTNRGGAVMNNINATGNPGTVNIGSGRGSYTGNAVALPGNGTANPTMAAPTGRGGRAVSFGGATGQPTYSTPATPSAGAVPSAAPRRGFFSGFFGNGSNPAGQAASAGQPANAGSYGSRQRSANYGQGQMQRSYSQPTYNQPARTFSQPTYSQPSRSFGGGSFGGGGGGSFGGGGGGGGGRGRR